MALAKVQSKGGVGTGSGGFPKNGSLTSTPTVGNLLLAFISCSITLSSIAVNTGSWTKVGAAHGDNQGTVAEFCLARYVQVGDTTALPDFCTSGNTFFAWKVIEVSGVAGTLDADIAFVETFYNASNSTTVSPRTRLGNVAGQLAIAGVAQFNGVTAGPTFSGSWTSDVSSFDHSNYGCWGLAHLAINDGDSAALTATFSGGTSAPTACVLVCLTPSAPTYPVVRRVMRRNPGSTTPGQLEGWLAPKQGTLQLAFFSWGNAGNAAPTIGASWTEFRRTISGNPTCFGLYRYPGAGESSLLPALCSSGTAYNFDIIVEIDGVTGSIGVDLALHQGATQTTGTTLTSSAQVTAINNALAIIVGFNYNGGNPTVSSGWTLEVQDNNASNYGGGMMAAQQVASSGSSITGTVTVTNGSFTSAMMQVIVGGGAGVAPPPVSRTSRLTYLRR